MITSPIVPLDSFLPCEDNILLKTIVEQKITIHKYIGKRRYSQAYAMLQIVKPLWSECNLSSLWQQVHNVYIDACLISGHIN